MSKKRYFIQVRGFDGHVVTAESAGQARYREFKAWKEAGYGRRGMWGEWSFIEFVQELIETFHHRGPPPQTPPR